MSKKLYSTISEVSKIIDVKPHTIRFWQENFKKLKLHKSKGGTRRFEEEDINILLKIKKLLYEDKYTIEGANQILNKSFKEDSEQKLDFKISLDIKKELEDILEILD